MNGAWIVELVGRLEWLGGQLAGGEAHAYMCRMAVSCCGLHVVAAKVSEVNGCMGGSGWM